MNLFKAVWYFISGIYFVLFFGFSVYSTVLFFYLCNSYVNTEDIKIIKEIMIIFKSFIWPIVTLVVLVIINFFIFVTEE